MVKNPAESVNPINQALVTLDSHSYTDGDYFGIAWKYDNIHQCQIDWYATEMDKLKAANNGVEVNNLVFFHIPLEEYRNAWANVIESGKSADELKSNPVIVGERARPSLSTALWANPTRRKTACAPTAYSAAAARTRF